MAAHRRRPTRRWTGPCRYFVGPSASERDRDTTRPSASCPRTSNGTAVLVLDGDAASLQISRHDGRPGDHQPGHPGLVYYSAPPALTEATADAGLPDADGPGKPAWRAAVLTLYGDDNSRHGERHTALGPSSPQRRTSRTAPSRALTGTFPMASPQPVLYRRPPRSRDGAVLPSASPEFAVHDWTSPTGQVAQGRRHPASASRPGWPNWSTRHRPQRPRPSSAASSRRSRQVVGGQRRAQHRGLLMLVIEVDDADLRRAAICLPVHAVRRARDHARHAGARATHRVRRLLDQPHQG